MTIGAPLNAEDASVTAGVGDTILAVNGKTSPSAFVTISRDGGVIGTTTANGAGQFSQNFPAQSPGLHQISIYATTTGGAQTDTVTTSVNIAEHGTTTVTVFLPPTLAIADDSPDYNQPLLVSGEGAPSCTITIFIDNNDYASATSDSQGKWALAVPTTALTPGSHSLFVRATDGLGAQSYPTSARPFTVALAPSEPQKTPQQPAAPNNPSPTQPPGDGVLYISVPRTSFKAYPDQPITLRATVINGQPPYSVIIEWGDGTTSRQNFSKNQLQFTNRYKQPGTYTATIEVTDAAGRQGSAYFTIIIEPTTFSGTPQNWWLLVIAFAIAVLLALIFFLKRRKKDDSPR